MKILVAALSAATLLTVAASPAWAASTSGTATPAVAPNQDPGKQAEGSNGTNSAGHGQGAHEKMQGAKKSAGKTEEKSYSNGMGFDAGAKNMTK